jgi:hypothetical protein
MSGGVAELAADSITTGSDINHEQLLDRWSDRQGLTLGQTVESSATSTNEANGCRGLLRAVPHETSGPSTGLAG